MSATGLRKRGEKYLSFYHAIIYKVDYSFILVDLQNDFASPGGKGYTPKPSMQFLQETIFPYFEEHGIKVNEIISDYRQPRPGDTGDLCYPGKWGYGSLLPNNLRKSLWIKCMNSPVWVREGIGNANAEPGLPFPNPEKFGEWLSKNVGAPDKVTPVLMGLTIDCCVLSTLQELSWRGYYPQVIKEAVDHASGKQEDKEAVLESPVPNWAEVVEWEEFLTNVN